MAIVPIPTEVVSTAAGASKGDHYKVTNGSRDALAQSFDRAHPEPVVLTAAGALVPAASLYVAADTFGAASTGELRTISLAAVPDGYTVRVTIAADARAVVAVHNANAGAGGGEIRLASAIENFDEVRLDRTTKSLELQRRGTAFVEVRRNGFTAVGGVVQNPAVEAIDAGHQILRRTRFLGKRVGGATHTPRRDDNGDVVYLDAACVVTLPNPNVADADGKLWEGGEGIFYYELGATARFQTHTGAAPAHPLDHDRGAGPDALVSALVMENPDGSLFWRLAGETMADPAAGGGGGGGVATPITRSYGLSPVLPDKTTSTSSTALEAVGTWAHTPDANSSYLYLVNAHIGGTGSSSNNPGGFQVVNTAAPSTPLCRQGRPRYNNHKNAAGMLFGAAYGASPSAQSFRVEARSGAASHSVTVEAARILALKLGANEGFAAQGGAVTDAANAYQTVATLTKASLPAGRYHVLAYCEHEMTATLHARHKLVVGGVDLAETVTTNNQPARGAFSAMVAVDHAGGNLTVALQGRRDDTAGTYSAFDGIVAILAAAAFAQADDAASAGESATTPPSTVFLTKISASKALKAGWSSLLLCSAQAMVADEDSTIACQLRWRRNGAALVPDARLGTRKKTDLTINYAPTSYLAWAVLPPGIATDAFTLEFGSSDGGAAARVKNAAMAMLALSA